MLARHVHAVLVLVAADHARVRVAPLTHQRHLDLADVGLVGADLKHRLVLDLEQVTRLALQRQSLPRSIRCTHVLDVVFSIDVGYRRVQVAQMLVVGEVE